MAKKVKITVIEKNQPSEKARREYNSYMVKVINEYQEEQEKNLALETKKKES